ncbi:hypothetical protein SELMODRAFT_418218 [Selaginella moellendorffii]|uniref:Uncharacterized protein n=1 Tax=Selaginella moellendorffii TaxID=88036 RepID=D8S519_SELML|nr:hypothetical protein SELMODRAFT_418218 [Selaginella moellendorffii]
MLGSWPSNPLLSASPAHEDAEGTLAQIMTSPGYDVEAWDDILQNRLVFLQKLHTRRRVTKPGRTSPNSLTRLSSGFQGSKGYRVVTEIYGRIYCTSHVGSKVCCGTGPLLSMEFLFKLSLFSVHQLFISTSWELALRKWGRLSRFGGWYESAPFWTAKTTIVWVLAMEFTVLRCFSHLYQTRYAFDFTMESFRDESEPKRQEVLKSNFPSFWLLFLRIILTRHRLPVISFSRHLVSLHRSSCLEVIPNRCLCLSRTPARKRCKRLMAETDGFVATTSDGFLVDQRMPLNEKSQRFLQTWKSTTNMYFRGLQSAPLVVKTQYCAFCGRGYDRMTETFGEDDVIISSWPGYTFVLVNAVAYAVLTALETHYTDVLMRLNEVTVASRKKDTPGNCGKASRYCAAPSEQSILEDTTEVAGEPDMRKRMQHLNTQVFLKQSHIFTKCLLLESSLPILEVTGIGWQRIPLQLLHLIQNLYKAKKGRNASKKIRTAKHEDSTICDDARQRRRMVSTSIWETVDRWIYAENVLELMGMAYLHENAWRFTST